MYVYICIYILTWYFPAPTFRYRHARQGVQNAHACILDACACMHGDFFACAPTAPHVYVRFFFLSFFLSLSLSMCVCMCVM